MVYRKFIARFFAAGLSVFLYASGFSAIIKAEPDGKEDRVRNEQELEKELSFNQVIPQIGAIEPPSMTDSSLLQKSATDNEPTVTSLPSGGKRKIDDEQALKAAEETIQTAGKQTWWRSLFFGLLFTCLGLGAWIGFRIWVEKNYAPPKFTRTKSKK
ncbi:MAG TPA: hypothetical protein VNK96_03345 [Fimbriimonadales bacterium]|nr:hypothetical protein [Fimbriimonadales bacterium]